MFSFHITPGEFENALITGVLDFCLRKTRAGKSYDYRNVLCFEMLPFRDGSVWMVYLRF